MSHETFTAPDLDQLAGLLPAYDFESFIAQGGMGAVYKARQRSLDREVAIKILPRELGADPEFRESFETEAKAMAKLNHPNLLGVYDFGDIDGMPYIVMEYVDGQSLYHSAWNVMVEPLQAVEIVLGICHGLAHAHEHGILHRDIKPANILLTPKAQPKIGDFGLAQATDSAGTGEAMGTPGYAAPELIHSPEQAGIGTDIYAVGVLLNELLTGHPPDQTGQTPLQASGDRRLDTIWRKATDPTIANRYHTAEEMAKDLAAWKQTSQRLKTGAIAGTSARRLVVATSAPKTAPIPQLKSARKGSGGGVLIAIILLAAIAYGYINFFKEDPPDDTTSDEVTESGEPPIIVPNPEEDSTTSDLPKKTVETPKSSEPTIDPDEPLDKAMARLKPELAAGKRDAFPPGTKRRGLNDYLFWDTPMNWYQAQAFAEEYGAHLATLQSQDDLIWISQMLPDDQTIWIGSGRLGSKVWTNIDGEKWTLTDVPKGVGLFATLNNHGILRAGKVSDKRTFVLQWHRDGSNPATLEAIFKRTKETLSTPNPLYPPGTDSLDARRLTIIPLPVTRTQAEKYSEMAGGILAVPATSSDADWIAERTENLELSSGIWLGGRRNGETWTWDSGEAWDKTTWAAGADPAQGGDALVHIPGKGWSTADPYKPAGGFAIEWNKDGAESE